MTSIQMRHGDGGRQTGLLIRDLFYRHFENDLLINSRDAAVFPAGGGQLAYTTDSFVVKPLFFNGGNIGRLAVCGTVNDLAAAGAQPLYLSAGFIIEDGFDIARLEQIVRSMGEACRQSGAKIVTGDTKVVEMGSADGIYINTSGIGMVMEPYAPRPLAAGDQILLTGTIAEHGTAILVERHDLSAQAEFYSDCMPLSAVIMHLGEELRHIKCMTDPTRGGIATTLCEIAEREEADILLEEDSIPIRAPVRALHRMLGTDPLYFASEGRMILFVQAGYAQHICDKLRENASDAYVIGSVCGRGEGIVRLKTHIGGQRMLTMLQNQMIPRIC